MTKSEREISIDKWKLRVSVATGLAGIVGLIVTYLSYQASVERAKFDRTLDLIALADKPHIEAARSDFQSYLIALGRANLGIDSTVDDDERLRRQSLVYLETLKRYRGTGPDGARRDTWSMIRPLGDYYLRVLACIDANACNEEIYCLTIADELGVFSRVTRGFREVAKMQKTFAEGLDKEVGRDRCE